MELNEGLPHVATPLAPEEALDLIPPLSTRGELNQCELVNIAECMRWAQKSRKFRSALLETSTRLLLHKRMFDRTWRWAGKLRKTQKNIGVEAWRIPGELEILLDDLAYWIGHETYGQREICARFHHRLVTIHFFANGNGRHARLATDLLCRAKGWNLPSWSSSDLISASVARQDYISALRQADRGHIQDLVHFMWS